MIKVAIIDDQLIIINGLQKILANNAGITVSGTFVSGDALLENLETEQPDVLLMDIQMPGKSGIELAGIISKKYPKIKMIALTNVDVFIQMKQMMQKGCAGYLLKDVSPEILINAIEIVHEGGQYLSDDFKKQLFNNLAGQNSKQLITRREKEILKLILEENTNQEIANKLFLSLRTVENHRNNLLQKLNVKNTAGLVKVALQDGLV